MDKKSLEARRKYHKEWRNKNKEKIKAAQARYWAKKAGGK
jgi:hypothetical protein